MGGGRFLDLLETRPRRLGRAVRQDYVPLHGHVLEIDGRRFGPSIKKRLAKKIRAWIVEGGLEEEVYGPVAS